MLRIFREQQIALARAERKVFRERVIANVKQIFPVQWVSMGEEASAALVDAGLERAASYGFSSEQDAFRFIALMIVLGVDFDTDPGLPWARSILDDSTLSGWQKMSTVMDRAMAHLKNEPNEESESSNE